MANSYMFLAVGPHNLFLLSTIHDIQQYHHYCTLLRLFPTLPHDNNVVGGFGARTNYLVWEIGDNNVRLGICGLHLV